MHKESTGATTQDVPVEISGNCRIHMEVMELSVPRNPNIIALFRFARQGENAGYGVSTR